MADELNELQKHAKDIANSLNILAKQAARNFAKELTKSAKSAGDLQKNLSNLLKNSVGLRKEFKSVTALEKAMTVNSKLYEQQRKNILKNFEKEKKEYWVVVNKFIDDQVKNTKGINKQLKEKEKLTKVYNNLIEKQEANLKNQLDELKETSGLWDVLKGGAVVTFSKMWDEAKKFGDRLGKGLENAMEVLFSPTFESAVEKFAKPFDDLLDSVPVVGGLLKGAFQILRKSFFSAWNYIEERVLPTNIALTKQFGEMIPGVQSLGKAAISMGDRFELMGEGLGKTARKAVVDFGAALQTTNFGKTQKDVSDLADVGIRLTEVVGLSAEQAGKLAIQFDRTGLSTADLKKAMVDASMTAEDFGVPVNQIRKDMGEYPNVLQRFGASNSIEFSKAAAMARAYGTNIKDVTSAFGEQLDSFDGTAQAATKLNAVFGTNINSFELMLETDPTKRMTMLGKAVLDTGRSWKSMDVSQKNVIKSTLGIDDAMGALVFSQKNVGMTSQQLNRTLEEQQKKQERAREAQERWDKSIGGLRTQLLNFKEAVDKIVRALGNSIAKFLGLPSAQKGVIEKSEQLNKVFQDIGGAIEKWNASGGPESLRKSLEKVFDLIEGVSDSWLVQKLFGKENQQISVTRDVGKVEKNIKALQENIASQTDPKMVKLLQYHMDTLLEERERALKKQGAQSSASKKYATFAGVRGDTLITNSGMEYQLSPKDNILATQAPLETLLPKLSEIVNVAGRSGGASVNAPMEQSLSQLVKAVQELNRNRTSDVKVEIVDINMDSRKVGEASVRMSRS